MAGIWRLLSAFVLACAMHGFSLAQTGAADAGELRKLALVIGNAAYQGAVPLRDERDGLIATLNFTI